MFRLEFSGEVRKPLQKEIGGKPCVEFQLMKKNYSKDEANVSFTWVKILLFDAKPWQIEQCREGCFVAGSGEFTMRSYTNKAGEKQQSAEVRCGSFDLNGPRTGTKTSESAARSEPLAKTSPSVPAPAPVDDDAPPF